jgi:hypothetical protein
VGTLSLCPPYDTVAAARSTVTQCRAIRQFLVRRNDKHIDSAVGRIDAFAAFVSLR